MEQTKASGSTSHGQDGGMRSWDGMSSNATIGRSAGNMFSKHRMELSLTMSEVDILLHPSSYDADDPTFGGGGPDVPKTVVINVRLSVPPEVTPPEKIGSMTIELRSDEVLGFSSGAYEKNQPHQASFDIDSAKDMRLARGSVYQWEIPFPLSHRTAPYERGVYGRLFHKFVVSIQWPGLAGWWKGGGRSLVAEHPVWIAAAPRDPSALMYSRTLNGHVRNLGPILLHIRSRHFSVGGYIRLALCLPAAQKGQEVHAIHATLIQRTTLHSRQQVAMAEECEPERLAFWKLSGEALEKDLTRTPQAEGVDGTERIQGQWVCRLPHDSQIRPSSLLGSESAIRKAHSIELKVVFRDPNGGTDLLAYSTRCPVVIQACGLLWRSVKLPSYSESDPSPVPDWRRDAWEPEKFANIHLSQTVCACGQSIEKLLGWEKEADDLDQNGVRIDSQTAVLHAIDTAVIMQNLRNSRPSSRSRSRVRTLGGDSSMASSRSVSRRPSLDLTTTYEVEEEEEDADGLAENNDDDHGLSSGDPSYQFDNEEEARAIEQERRRRLKEAQMYRPE
jgi:hypothetical protein